MYKNVENFLSSLNSAKVYGTFCNQSMALGRAVILEVE
jgi:hypothetical protein